MSAEEFVDKFADSDNPIRLLGEGLVYHKDKFKTAGVEFFDEDYWSPKASKVHLLGWKMALAGEFSDPLTLIPAYLQRPVVKIKQQ